MAVKKYIGIIFIAFMLTIYLYLSGKYNIRTVEYAYTGEISLEQFNSLRKATKTLVKTGSINKEVICVINHIGSYKGNKLIMTTGFDNLVKNIPMAQGSFISGSQIKEVAIGDKAADRLFRSMNIVGQRIYIHQQEYIVTGVIKNSEDIYITFDEASNISWNKKNIKFIVENQKYLYLYTEMLEGKLRILNLEVLNPVIYKNEAYRYINLMIMLILLFLFRTMKNHIIKTKDISKRLYTGYIEQKRTIEIIKYIRKNISCVFQNVKELFLLGFYLLATIKCISYLQIPPYLIPSNLFALTSYIDVVKQNADRIINRLDYGISGIALDTSVINLLILTALIGALYYLQYSKIYREKV